MILLDVLLSCWNTEGTMLRAKVSIIAGCVLLVIACSTALKTKRSPKSSKRFEMPKEPIAPIVTRGEIAPRMLAPGYYSQECNAHKACPEKKYCHLFLCVHCLKENVACTQNGQCCEGQCTYGRCKAGVTEGQPGTFCDRHEDCAGEGKAACCVREPAINPHISICKPPLAENMVCGPVNFFRNVYVGAQVQKACGPCAQGLMCKQVGLFGIHEICLKEDD